jgi:RNA polymerase sigma factor (sigma-70 family)
MNLRLTKGFKVSDAEIIRGIANGGKAEDQSFRSLYQQYFRMIEDFVLKNNGNSEDGKNIFHDAIINLYEQVKSGKYQPTAKLSTYLYSVSRNLWFNELKKKKREFAFRETQSIIETDDIPSNRTIENDKRTFINQLLDKLKGDCKQVLLYAIFEKMSMKEIYEKMGFQNEQVARNKKSKCLGFLKKIINESIPISQALNDMR